jgi:hypothetical protein
MLTARLEAINAISGYEEEMAGDDGVRGEGAWALAAMHDLRSAHGTRADHALQYCHDPVQALMESSNGVRAHVEHLQKHAGWRFLLGRSVGWNRNHPLALD